MFDKWASRYVEVRLNNLYEKQTFRKEKVISFFSKYFLSFSISSKLRCLKFLQEKQENFPNCFSLSQFARNIRLFYCFFFIWNVNSQLDSEKKPFTIKISLKKISSWNSENSSHFSQHRHVMIPIYKTWSRLGFLSFFLWNSIFMKMMRKYFSFLCFPILMENWKLK